MTKRKILVTGAAGEIALQVLPALYSRYELVLLDLRPAERACEESPRVQIVDLTNRDRNVYRHHFQGVNTVIHCAYVNNDTPDERDHEEHGFWDELANVQMAYNIYQTSLEMGVRRVVAASSNHAADYFEPLILDGHYDSIDPGDRALSDNYYGWAKEAYEHLGFVFAAGKQTRSYSTWTTGIIPQVGQQLEIIQIRIGGPRETDVADCAKGNLRCVRRALGAYISNRDLQQLFVKSVDAEDIRDDRGVPFQIFYGISGNTRAFWSIDNARQVIGYVPEDNSEIRFADLIAEHSKAAQEAEA
jgi:nucleoside-diphosphate-sugar epimerase